MAKKKKKNNKIVKVLLLIIVMLLAVGGYTFYNYYTRIYQPNVILDSQSKYYYLKAEYNFDDVINSLYEGGFIQNRSSFEWVAEKKNLKNKIYHGKYLINNKLSNNQLVNLLRSGEQEFVKIVFNNVRTKEQLASKVSRNIEADSLQIIDLLNNKKFISKYGFNSQTVISMFLPDTYEFSWSTSAEDFFVRMAKEYKSFWTDKRKQKASNLNMSQSQVSTLASIVEQESRKNDEKPIVAGVYINRLKKGMRLQADPTVIFAVGDFSIKRLLTKHLKYDSPYNTYRYKGLPPGPICIPAISSIDAVLDYKKHKYIFFCAKEDFSGYHNFAVTLSEHNRNARKYQNRLNKLKVYK